MTPVTFATVVCGIPCKVRVTSYEAEVEGRTWGPPESCYPPEPAEVSFDVLDRNGRPAPWLERKMDDCDTRAVEQEAIAVMEEHEQTERDLALEARAEDQHFFGELA